MVKQQKKNSRMSEIPVSSLRKFIIFKKIKIGKKITSNQLSILFRATGSCKLTQAKDWKGLDTLLTYQDQDQQ